MAYQAVKKISFSLSPFLFEVRERSNSSLQQYGTFAHIFANAPESKRDTWMTAQFKTILKNEVYIGNSVHNKQSAFSFKSKKKVRKLENKWFRAGNTQETIIDKDVGFVKFFV